MAENTDLNRGNEFARDLKEIRQANGISIDDIHEESKIPVGLIESFEGSGLFDHTMFNRVYLRSFVRTYADVIGISPELALSALESALDGTYRRELAVEYLNFTPPVERVDEDEDTVLPEPEAAGEPASTPPVTGPPEPPPAPPALVEPRVEEELEMEDTALSRSGADVEPETAAAEVHDHAWASQSPPPSMAPRPPQAGSASRTPWIIGGVVILLLAAGVWGAVRMGGDTDPAPETTAVPAADTLALSEEPEPTAARPVSLGDTMRVTIASRDSQLVQDIKVTVDDDLRRPYWMEAGESRTFTPVNQIIIERELDAINLLVEGQPYPTNRVDDRGRIVITRDTALQFLQNTP